MIEINHPLFSSPMLLRDNCVNALIIENPQLLYNITKDIFQLFDANDSETKILVNKEMPKDYSKIFLIDNLLDINVNSKKILGAVNKLIAKRVLPDSYKLNEIYSDGYKLLCNIIEDINLPIILESDMDINNFIKLYNPSISYSYDTLIEQLVGAIDIMIEVYNINLLITINIQDFLCEEDYFALLKHCENRDLKWLSIQANSKYHNDKINTRLIDNDLCEVLA